MFKMQKHAVLGGDAASNGQYDTAKLQAAVNDGRLTMKDKNYLAPITVTVVGCGDSLPKDGDLKITADVDGILNDVSDLIDEIGVTAFGEILNNGLNLAPRSGRFNEFKKSQRKVSDNDKVVWVMVNLPAKFQPGQPIAAYVKLYDDANKTT